MKYKLVEEDNGVIAFYPGGQSFTPDSGTFPEGVKVVCGLCGDRMTEQRGQYGATGFAEGMSGGRHHYDSYQCPNYGRGWHDQINLLRTEASRTASKWHRDHLNAEIELIVETRKATIEEYTDEAVAERKRRVKELSGRA